MIVIKSNNLVACSCFRNSSEHCIHLSRYAAEAGRQRSSQAPLDSLLRQTHSIHTLVAQTTVASSCSAFCILGLMNFLDDSESGKVCC